MRKAICVICGAEFEKYGNKKTCSLECAKRNEIQREAEHSRRRWASRHVPKTAVCTVCGSEFRKTTQSLICSEACRSRRVIEARQSRLVPPNPIDPFPADIDREAFGHWLSGFTDGEGSFNLQVHYKKRNGDPSYTTRFSIALRDDDTKSLKLIQSYFGCGKIYFHPARVKTVYSNPIATYGVQRVTELVRVIIPHFDRFPLRAKKRRDFAVWREGVRLMNDVLSRPWEYRIGHPINHAGGHLPKWTKAERERFVTLATALKEQRLYANGSAPPTAAPDPQPGTRQSMLL